MDQRRASFETAASQPPQDEDFLNAISDVPHGEERQGRVSNHAPRGCKILFSSLAAIPSPALSPRKRSGGGFIQSGSAAPADGQLAMTSLTSNPPRGEIRDEALLRPRRLLDRHPRAA